MEKSILWRSGFAGALIIAALVWLVPSLAVELPSWWAGFMPKEKIHLGLDLQGGVHLILEVDTKKAVESTLERVVEDLKQDLRKEKIRYLELRRDGIQGVLVTLMRQEDGKPFEELVGRNYGDFKVRAGPQKDEGMAMELILDPGARTQAMKMAADQALETIRNRIDQFGVSEPDIRPQPNSRVLVQLPGVKDPKRAIELIGKTALLEFKLVDEEGSLEAALKGNVPAGSEILYETNVDRKTGAKRTVPFLLKKRTLITGEYITDARVQLDSQFGEPYVLMSFNRAGARLFERITGENIGKRLAIVLDNNVYSAPVIRDKIAGGRAQITGSFRMEEARDLAIVLRAGALPAPVKILEERTVGPSLGKDSINQGIKSSLIGGALVLIMVAVYYGLSGLIANVALLLNVPLILAGLAAFGATLTLPGIAGVILTVGMAVDANVLIFERIREELRLGKTTWGAIEAGYDRALITILDSNLTTFITALVLFQFGTGPVKGFAVTLSIGLVASFYTGVYVTRIFFDYLYVLQRRAKISI